MTKLVEAEERMSKAVLLEDKLRRLIWELKEAVDLTIEVRRESPQIKHESIRLWEEFLGQFFGYIKYRSKESKDNLLAGISLTRLKLF